MEKVIPALQVVEDARVVSGERTRQGVFDAPIERSGETATEDWDN
jgi:hypothetical protein